jgi:hypothetical protein
MILIFILYLLCVIMYWLATVAFYRHYKFVQPDIIDIIVMLVPFANFLASIALWLMVLIKLLERTKVKGFYNKLFLREKQRWDWD